MVQVAWEEEEGDVMILMDIRTSGRNFVLMTELLVEHLGGNMVQVEHREKVLLTFNNYSPKAKSILLNNPPDEVDFCKL